MLDQIKSIVSPIMAGHAAKAVGETQGHADDALNKALPAILSAMVAATKVPSGLASLFKVVNDPVNDGALLTRLSALYQGTMTSAPIYGLGAQLQQTIFGSKLPLVTQSIAALSGTKPAAATTLVNQLSTHVLAHVGDRLRQSGTVSPAGLARLLQSEEKSFAAGLSPAIGSVLGIAPSAASMPSAAATAAAVAATPAAVLAATKAAAPTTQPERTPAPASATTEKTVSAPVPTKAAAAPTVPARTTSAAASTTGRTSTPTAAAPATRASGFQPWTIFPIGLLVGGGLAGLAGMFGPGSAPVERTPATDRPMAAAPAVPTPAPKVVEAAKPAPAPKAVETPKSAPKPAPKVAEAPPTPKPAPAPVADVVRPLGAPGVTSFFGASPTPAEKPAVLNPDYKPAVAAAAVAAPEAPPKPTVPGVTTFFGQSPVPAEKPAMMNPDYKPAAPAVVAASAPVVAATPRPLGAPGVTSFFGASPNPAEKPAVMNPDYKPATKAVASAPAAGPLAPAFQACQDNINSAVKTGGIRFNSAKSSLTDTSVITLTQIAAAITACPGAKLSIEGHTDDSGNDDMNQKLSEDRARTVVEFLVDKGIDAKRLTSVGYGETRPIAPNDSAANKARNRRIDFVLSAS